MGEAHVAEGGTAVEKLAYPDAVGATVSERQNISPFPDKQVFGCPVSECQQWCGFCARKAAVAVGRQGQLPGRPVV